MDTQTTFCQFVNKQEIKNYCETEDLKTLHTLKISLDDLYYNTGDSIVDDWKYDLLKNILQYRDPNWVPPIGTKMRKHANRVNLPHWLGSIDKITSEEEKELDRWIGKNPANSYVCTDKLDGVSCLVEYSNGRIKMYTRGDGEVGADISYIINYHPKLIPSFEDINRFVFIRGELIIPKHVFETKHSTTYKNPRNMISGLIGSKTLRNGMTDIDFVAYEIVEIDQDFKIELPRDCTSSKPEDHIICLNDIGFKTPKMEIKTDLNVTNLTNYLEQRKNRSKYELDGLVIQSNVAYCRNTTGNPSYSFAFKVNTEENIITTTVQKIDWSVSKWGCIKPVVIVDPVESQGVTISRATAHNAKYIVDNNLGQGAVVRVTRSNDVIPYIVEVIENKNCTPDMPDIEYKWDETRVNIYVRKHNQIMDVKIISSFFSKLRIKHISEMTILRLFKHGFNNLKKILEAKVSDLEHIPQLGSKSAHRIVNNIRDGLVGVDRDLLIGASGIFGQSFGRKRVKLLTNGIPDIFENWKNMTKTELKTRVLAINGFSSIMADKVVDNIEKAGRFLTYISKFATFNKNEENKNEEKKDLIGQKFIFTGFRDQKVENRIIQRGGEITGSVSGKTTAVVVKNDKYKESAKTKKAKSLNIPIYTVDRFVQKILH